MKSISQQSASSGGITHLSVDPEIFPETWFKESGFLLAVEEVTSCILVRTYGILLFTGSTAPWRRL